MMRLKSILLILLAISVVGCAQNIIDVPPPMNIGTSSYGWDLTSHVLYTSESATTGTTSTIALDFVVRAQAGSYDAIETYSFGASDTLELRSTTDSLSISGITTSSVIPLPRGYSATITERDTVVSARPLHTIFAFGDGAEQLVGADDSNVVYYSGDGGMTWSHSSGWSISVSASIIGFVSGIFDSKTVVAAATTDGKFFTSSDGGKTWTALITQLGNFSAMSSATSGIYVATTSGQIYLMGNRPTLESYGFPSTDSTIVALGVWTNPNSQLESFIGASANGGLYWSESDSGGSWHTLKSLARYASVVAKFIARLGDNSFVIGFPSGTAGGLIVWNAKSDSVSQLSSASFVEAVADGKTNTTVVVVDAKGATSEVNSSSGNITYIQLKPLGLIGTNEFRSLACNNGIAFAGTRDSALYSYHLSQATSGEWTRVSGGGPLQTTTINQILPLTFTLLAPESDGLRVGARWTAGTLRIDSNEAERTVSAEVVRYVDSLKLTNGLTFKNLFVINYDITDQNGLTTNSPIRWTIYFAKGQGPVLIDEVQESSGTLLSRIYRAKE